MEILKGVLVATIIYLLLAIFIPLIFRPHRISKKIQTTKKIKSFSRKLSSTNKEKTIKNIFNYVTKTYKGKEESYKLLNFPKLFYKDINHLLNKPQFLACHIQNLIIKTLLINSGQFKLSDIQEKETIARFGTIHQYLIIKLNKKQIKIDPFFKIITPIKI